MCSYEMTYKTYLVKKNKEYNSMHCMLLTVFLHRSIHINICLIHTQAISGRISK